MRLYFVSLFLAELFPLEKFSALLLLISRIVFFYSACLQRKAFFSEWQNAAFLIGEQMLMGVFQIYT